MPGATLKEFLEERTPDGLLEQRNYLKKFLEELLEEISGEIPGVESPEKFEIEGNLQTNFRTKSPEELLFYNSLRNSLR